MKNQIATQQDKGAHVEEDREQQIALRVLFREVDVSCQHRLFEVFVVVSDRCMELLLRRRFHVPAKVRSLDLRVLNQVFAAPCRTARNS